MSEIELGHVEGREPDSGGRVQRKNRQQQRRARLTATPQKRVPWAALVQTLVALVLVVVVVVLLDWLQPLELIVVAIVFMMCSVTALVVTAKPASGRMAVAGKRLLGPILFVASIALMAGTMWCLQRFPESAAYTDRQVIETQQVVGQLIASEDWKDASKHLSDAIEGADSEFWKQRWSERLTSIEGRNSDRQSGEALGPDALSANAAADSQDRRANATKPDERDSQIRLGNNPSGISDADPIQERNTQPESVLQAYLHAKENNGYSAAAKLLRDAIREQPRSSWQGDYAQWYVDHWTDWGNIQTDLDQRHYCFSQALKTARQFELDDSNLSSMLINLEQRIQFLPVRLPAGCQVQLESVARKSHETRVELFVLTSNQRPLGDLAAKDFRATRGEMELRGISVVNRSHPQTDRNLVVLVDQSESNSAINNVQMEGVRRFFDDLPDRTAIQLIVFSGEIKASGWGAKTTGNIPAPSSPSPSSLPSLRPAIGRAMQALADRDGIKDLIIVSSGRENPRAFVTTTSLLQRATEQGIRVHAVLPQSPEPSVKRLLADLVSGSGGTVGAAKLGDVEAAWSELSKLYPTGSYVLRIPNVGGNLGKLQLTVGRGATLVRTDLDGTAEERLTAEQGRR